MDILRRGLAVCGLLALLAGLLGLQADGLAMPAAGAAQPAVIELVWGRKPVLEYFFWTQGLAELAAQELDLSPAELEAIKELARQEGAQLRALQVASEALASAPQIEIDKKRAVLQSGDYQAQFERILQDQQRALRAALDETTYARLISWIETRWHVEREQHNTQHSVALQANGARTYTVYATLYDAGGRYTVALPDQCVKFANAGIASQTECANHGYEDGANYSISIAYQGKSVSVRPLEAGPWNVDDTFWATVSDPTPRRMFADLPLGMPQAQAAYFDNYNGGLDQFGRIVKQPFAIDLSFDVAADLGISGNAWVDVTFLWTAGWGAPDSGSGEVAGGVPQVIIPVTPATPDADGKLFHEVQPGQTLWAIAMAYEVTIDDLEAWNDLSRQDSLLIGSRLVIPDVNTISQGTPTPVGMIQAEDGRVIHLVQPGENLSMIAERYAVEVGVLLQLNDLQPDWPLQIGQQLLIQAGAGSGVAGAPPLTAFQTLTPESDGRYYHTIAEGETLSSIADLYAISVFDLMSWNGINEAAVIRPGEKLLLQVTPPASATPTPVLPTATRTATKTAALSAAPSPTPEAIEALASATAAPSAKPTEGANWALWLTALVFLGGGAILMVSLSRRRL